MRIKTKEDRRQRIKFRIRKRLQGTADRATLVVAGAYWAGFPDLRRVDHFPESALE